MKEQLKKALEGTDLGGEMADLHGQLSKVEKAKSTLEGEGRKLEVELATSRAQSEADELRIQEQMTQIDKYRVRLVGNRHQFHASNPRFHHHYSNQAINK